MSTWLSAVGGTHGQKMVGQHVVNTADKPVDNG